jgi:hypothetical protein
MKGRFETYLTKHRTPMLLAVLILPLISGAVDAGDTMSESVTHCAAGTCTRYTFNYVWVNPAFGLPGHWQIISTQTVSYPDSRYVRER